MFDSIKFHFSPPDILRICDGNAVITLWLCYNNHSHQDVNFDKARLL